MKKIIALAVAAAAAPAFAAVSISGSTEFSYSDLDNNSGTGGNTTTAGMEQTVISFAGSSELSNGTTISASATLNNDGGTITTDNGATAITLSGAWGTLGLGDVGGPLDSRDGAAAATAGA